MTHPRLDRIAKALMIAPFVLACWGQWHGYNALIAACFFAMIGGFVLYVWNGGRTP